jgi:hypothetical protein
MGKSSINGPFSMAMLNNQRVYIYTYIYIDILGGGLGVLDGYHQYHRSISRAQWDIASPRHGPEGWMR